MEQPKTGSCLCGSVSIEVFALNRQVLACHCQQCRKQSGHMVAAFKVLDKDLRVTGDQHIRWYAASDIARRGFCQHCGSLLFWKRNGSDTTSIMAGCMESPTGLTLVGHIFTDDKGDYYELDDTLRRYPQSSGQ